MNPIQAQSSSVGALVAELNEQIALSVVATDDSFPILEAWRSRAQEGSGKRESVSQDLNRSLSEALESSKATLERALNLLLSISDERKQLHQRNSSELRDAQDSVEKLEILPRTLDVKALGGEVRSFINEMQTAINKTEAAKVDLFVLELESREFRELCEKAILELPITTAEKVETFKKTTEVFAENSRELKDAMKNARNLCKNA
jgi:hypothetical protein